MNTYVYVYIHSRGGQEVPVNNAEHRADSRRKTHHGTGFVLLDGTPTKCMDERTKDQMNARNQNGSDAEKWTCVATHQTIHKHMESQMNEQTYARRKRKQTNERS